MNHRSLTVVQLLPAMESGGVERGTLEVADELVRRGHRSIVISEGGRLVPDLLAAGSEHVGWPIGRKSPRTLFWVGRLRRYLRRERVDILHARSRVPAWVAYLAWRTMDTATRPHFVTTCHGLYSVNRYSAIMTRGERVEAVSQTVRRYILEHYPRTDPAKLRLIYRGVDPEQFPYRYQPDRPWLDAWYRQYPQLVGRRVITLPGRLTRLKGHTDFVPLMVRLKQTHPAVRGLIVGGEDPRRRRYAAQVRELIQRHHLDNLILTGHRSDMRQVLAVSDIVLSLSTKPESFGRAVLEALSMGVPVVGYDHGGVGEVLGEVFPTGRVGLSDIEQLTDRVRAFLDHPPTVQQTGRFTRAQMLEKTISMYQELVGVCGV